MPNQRAPGQKLLNFPAKEVFIRKIALGVERSGLGDRSKFIREAVREKLTRLGVDATVEESAAPPRTSTTYPDHKPSAAELNDKPSSKADAGAAAAAKKAAAAERKKKKKG